MRPSRERKLDAYCDDALSQRQRARLDRRIEADPEAERFVRGRAALSDLVRESWTGGPPPPDPDRLLAAIRPAMRRIDAERAAARRPWGVAVSDWLRGWRHALSPAALAPAGLAAAAMAGMLLAGPGTLNRPREAHHILAERSGPQAVEELRWPSSVYDLAQEDVPLMVYEKAGATVFFFGDASPPAQPFGVPGVEPLPDPAEDISHTSELLEGWA
jgi:AcrR family transcriptional regulator